MQSLQPEACAHGSLVRTASRPIKHVDLPASDKKVWTGYLHARGCFHERGCLGLARRHAGEATVPTAAARPPLLLLRRRPERFVRACAAEQGSYELAALERKRQLGASLAAFIPTRDPYILTDRRNHGAPNVVVSSHVRQDQTSIYPSHIKLVINLVLFHSIGAILLAARCLGRDEIIAYGMDHGIRTYVNFDFTIAY
jgi:hypothetical protein